MQQICSRLELEKRFVLMKLKINSHTLWWTSPFLVDSQTPFHIHFLPLFANPPTEWTFIDSPEVIQMMLEISLLLLEIYECVT